MKEEGLDPLAESLLANDLRSIEGPALATLNNAEPPQMKGLLLFVHGTPCDGKISTMC